MVLITLLDASCVTCACVDIYTLSEVLHRTGRYPVIPGYCTPDVYAAPVDVFKALFDDRALAAYVISISFRTIMFADMSVMKQIQFGASLFADMSVVKSIISNVSMLITLHVNHETDRVKRVFVDISACQS